jgi:hypothetical protein
MNNPLNGQFKNQLQVSQMLSSWGFLTRTDFVVGEDADVKAAIVQAVIAELQRQGYIKPPAMPATSTSNSTEGRGGMPLALEIIIGVLAAGGAVCGIVALCIKCRRQRRRGLTDETRGVDTPYDIHETPGAVVTNWATPKSVYRKVKPTAVALAEQEAEAAKAEARIIASHHRLQTTQILLSQERQLAMALAGGGAASAPRVIKLVLADEDGSPRRRSLRLAEDYEGETEAEREARLERMRERRRHMDDDETHEAPKVEFSAKAGDVAKHEILVEGITVTGGSGKGKVSIAWGDKKTDKPKAGVTEAKHEYEDAMKGKKAKVIVVYTDDDKAFKAVSKELEVDVP